MDSMILMVLATCFFLPYIIYQYNKKKKHFGNIKRLSQVEAGSTKRFFNRKTDSTSLVSVDMKNISIDPNLRYFVVKNQCMQTKGISDGDIIGVRMLNDKDKISALHKKGLILLIYLDDQNFKGYKIREQGEITNNKMAYNTYHYKDGVQHKSSKPHSIESIKGIVEEIHQKQYMVSAI